MDGQAGRYNYTLILLCKVLSRNNHLISEQIYITPTVTHAYSDGRYPHVEKY
jgi:hypothetical protein